MSPPSNKRKGRPTGSSEAPGSRPDEGEATPSEREGAPVQWEAPRPPRARMSEREVSRLSRRARLSADELVPTSVYAGSDEELAPSYEAGEVSEPGFRQVFLYVERGPGAGQLVPIRQGELVIGRASISDLRLAHPSVSRRHAQLLRMGERLYLRDVGSQNGTRVNRHRIHSEVELQLGDELRIGNAVLKLRGPARQASSVGRSGSLGAAEWDGRPRHRERIARPTPTPPSSLRMGLYGVFIGFGLAGVLALALLKLERGPSYTPLLSAPTPSAPTARPNEVELSAEAPRVSRNAAKPPSRATSAPPPLEPSAPILPAVATPVPTVAPRGARSAVAPVSGGRGTAEARAPTPGTPAESGILARYEEGDLAGALVLARTQGATELLDRLSLFQTTYEDAHRALDVNDGAAAIQGFSSALRQDEQLSNGWSEFAVEIRTQLSRLYALAGDQHLRTGHPDNAQKAYDVALKYNPDNAQARQGLSRLRAKASSSEPNIPAARQERTRAIDDAFGD